MSQVLSADVIIVGSGVAGVLVAATLARGGVNVLVLEAGPRVDRAKALVHFRKSASKSPNSPYPAHPKVPQPDDDDIGAYYVQAGPETFNTLQARVVGGTTWHWGGLALRYHPNDFRMRSRYGVAVDWPLAYDDLEPWYGEAESALGVAGPDDEDWGSPRSSRYPMPVVAPTYLDKIVGAACSKVGLKMAPFPQARNTVPRDDRPACCGNASCVPLCPVGAKYDAGVHVAKAIAAGARVEALAIAHEVVVDGTGNVTAIRFMRPDGSVNEARGKVFVIAAHAIESAKLLLMSRDRSRYPAGVANSSGVVGRYLLTQLDAGMIGLSKQPVYPYRGPVSTSGILGLRDGDFRATYGASACSPSNEGWTRAIGPMKLAAELARNGRHGTALGRAVSDHASREVAIGPSVEVLPNADNRVTLAEDQRDPLGLPRPQIAFRFGEYELEGMRIAMDYMLGIMNALEATNVQRQGPVTDGAVMGGTCRMGNDPRHAVVDRNLRSHDHQNLYVVGSAAFPTISTSPPTLTIAAFALRAGTHILTELRQR